MLRFILDTGVKKVSHIEIMNLSTEKFMMVNGDASEMLTIVKYDFRNSPPLSQLNFRISGTEADILL